MSCDLNSIIRSNTAQQKQHEKKNLKDYRSAKDCPLVYYFSVQNPGYLDKKYEACQLPCGCVDYLYSRLGGNN